jgi:HEAT repeat protein
MIASSDTQNSTIDVLVFQALKQYSTNALLPMLEDRDVIVRSAVARELQIRGGDDVFAFVLSLAGSDRHESREIAAFTLGQLGVPVKPYRNQSIPTLMLLLSDKYYEVRSTAAAALGHLHAEEARNELIELATDSESEVRECVAFALGLIKANKKSIVALKMLSEEQDKNIRDCAEFALEQHNVKR